MNKVSLSFSRFGRNAHAFTSLGIALLTAGLVSSCGDDDPGGTSADPDAGASTTTSGTTTTTTTTTTSNTSTTTFGTTTESDTTTSTIDLTTDPTTATSTDTTDIGTTDTTSDTETATITDEPDTTEDSDSDCGGGGQPCCDLLACDPGLLCVGGDVVNDAGSSEDSTDSAADGGVVPLEAGMFNQFFDDASVDAGEQDPFVPSVDAGEQDPFVPLPMDASVTNGGFPVEAGTTPPALPGICEPCGGDGEQCCADDVCSEGLSCSTTGFGPNATSSCETVVPPGGDGGDDTSCGTLGAQCCPGGGGNCEDGLDCDNGPMRGLGDSECVSAAAERDSGLR